MEGGAAHSQPLRVGTKALCAPRVTTRTGRWCLQGASLEQALCLQKEHHTHLKAGAT